MNPRRQPTPSSPARPVASRSPAPGSGTADLKLTVVSLSILTTEKFGSGEKKTLARFIGGRG